jgi:hypothetical protein
MLRFFVLLAACASLYAERFPFTVAQRAEVIASLEMSSPGADWAKRGSEAAVVDVALNGKLQQQVILYAGETRRRYRFALGLLPPGEHEITVERNATHSAGGTSFQAFDLRTEEVGPGHPSYEAYARAPILFARLNTIGKFSDIPLLLYCERLKGETGDALEYSVVFSNEDGGTSTRALMARWGRSTDIEYVYRRALQSGKAIVQGPGHKDIEFTGEYDTTHPLLMPVTDNNMIAEGKDSPLRFRPAVEVVDLSDASREEVMDRHPETYAVMAKELEREGKLRPFGVAAGEKISDPRNYLFVDFAGVVQDATITVTVQLSNGQTYSSDLGRLGFAVTKDALSRAGAARTTIELPPGTLPTNIARLVFDCRVAPAPRNEPMAHSGRCEVRRVAKVFMLRPDYTPGKSFWWVNKSVTLSTGAGVAFNQ